MLIAVVFNLEYSSLIIFITPYYVECIKKNVIYSKNIHAKLGKQKRINSTGGNKIKISR